MISNGDLTRPCIRAARLRRRVMTREVSSQRILHNVTWCTLYTVLLYGKRRKSSPTRRRTRLQLISLAVTNAKRPPHRKFRTFHRKFYLTEIFIFTHFVPTKPRLLTSACETSKAKPDSAPLPLSKCTLPNRIGSRIPGTELTHRHPCQRQDGRSFGTN